jgi:hypothetical protein
LDALDFLVVLCALCDAAVYYSVLANTKRLISLCYHGTRGMAGVPAGTTIIIRTGMFFPQRENEDLLATISDSSDSRQEQGNRPGRGGVLIDITFTARGMIL